MSSSDGHVHDSEAFSSAFPLPLRILSLVSLGVAAWATNLHLLATLGIDTAQVLDIRASEDHLLHHGYANLGSSASGMAHTTGGLHLHPSRLYPPIYKLALALAGWTCVGWVAYSAIGQRDSQLATFLPAAFLFLAVAALLLPTNTLCRRERGMLLRSLQRTLFEGIFSPVPFCDVLTADILTSFAKVIGDVWISVGLLVNADTRQGWGGHWGVPLLTSLPYLLRFRQCIAEHMTSAPHPTASSPSPPVIPVASTPFNPRTRSLCNALKYATAFPVILLSAVQGHKDLFEESDDGTIAHPTSRFIFNVWMSAVLVNSLYSFWWDVTNDWGLSLLIPSAWKAPPPFIASSMEKLPFASPARSAASSARAARLHSRARSIATANRSVDEGQDFVLQPPKPASPSRSTSSLPPDNKVPPVTYHASAPFLRSQLLMPDPWVYYAAIAIDLLLRLTWSLKLSSHLHAMHELDQGIYLMEALEVIRRWMWTFIRIEWEAVKRAEAAAFMDGHGFPEDLALQERYLATVSPDTSGLGISGVGFDHEHPA